MKTNTYQCKNCGGGLIYNPKTGKLKCEYCLTEYSQDEFVDELTSNTKDDPKKRRRQESYCQYHCPTCGAEIITDETTTATFCYYCHSQVILDGKLQGTYLPDKIIPFSISRKEAIKKFEKWISKKKFLVRGFYSKKQIEKMTGVYLPYWLVNCKLEGGIEAVSKRINSWYERGNRYVETEIYQTDRVGDIEINNMPNFALNKLNKDIVNNIFPFKWDGITKFDKKYLLGFQADKHNLGKRYFEEEIYSDLKTLTTQHLKESIFGYNRTEVKECFIDIKEFSCEHALLPVYLLTYKYKDELYYFALNGQTGKTAGRLPLDYKKLILTSIMIAVSLAVALVSLGVYIW